MFNYPHAMYHMYANTRDWMNNVPDMYNLLYLENMDLYPTRTYHAVGNLFVVLVRLEEISNRDS